MPEQIEVAFAFAVTIGNALIVTRTCAVFEQEFASVPVTVYVAVAAGENAVPSTTLLLHVYVEAPPPVNVTCVPAQTIVSVAFAITSGNGFTVTETDGVTVVLPNNKQCFLLVLPQD